MGDMRDTSRGIIYMLGYVLGLVVLGYLLVGLAPLILVGLLFFSILPKKKKKSSSSSNEKASS
jgi:uncharacterized membrane protein YuzA (DUF378 family)